MEEMNERHVLSVQSHVVSGYVGNKSATFPLQVLGFDVEAINSVQFSTHTGYAHCTGQVLNASDLEKVFEGIRLNNLHKRYTHILTGYAASESFLNKVFDIIEEVKYANPKAIYLCDPVMGDAGRMYVPKELMPLYRDKITLIADIITPNQYEAELLTGVTITSEADAFKAINVFHSRGIKTVVISSTDLGDDTKLIALASTKINGTSQSVRIVIPKFPVTFTGTGDLFAALFIAWFTITDGDLKVTCEKTVSTLQDILKRTYRYAQQQKGGIILPENVELRLVQSKDDIENPKSIVEASHV